MPSLKMRKLALLMMASVLLLGASPQADAVLVARYSFDDGAFSGSGVAGDPWVVHDLIAPAATASAIGANGGANIVPSQPGIFGQSFRFSEDEDADVNDLTTLENLLTMPPSTAPFGTAARTFSLWFNAEANDDQDKIFGYGTASADRTFEVGLEEGGVRLRTFGGNIIYGENMFDFTGADSGWNHLAVRHDGSAIFAGVDMFVNGEKLSVGTVGGDALNDMINTADSPFGIGTGSVVGSGLNQAFTGRLDEFRIYDNALSDSEIAQLAMLPTLTLEVHSGTGRVFIKNESEQDFNASYYEISSADIEQDGGSLNVGNWVSLQDQNLPGFPAGNGNGLGWEEGGGSNDKMLGEGFLGAVGQGASLFASGMTPINLGTLFDTTASQDLSFTYQLLSGEFIAGEVVYISGSIEGDYNDDGSVDAIDYAIWRENLGTTTLLPNDPTPGMVTSSDFETWRLNFGRTPGANFTNISTPEPNACLLLTLAMVLSIAASKGASIR